MTILMNVMIGAIVYSGMAALYAAIVIVPLALVLGGLRLRTAVQHNTHRPTMHRHHRHGYQTH